MPTRVCVVTGASSGIGRATAVALGRARARMVLAARREELLEEVGGEVRAAGGEAVVVPCDVTKKTDLRRLVTETERAYGRCDVLVNNAGVPGGGRFADVSLQQLDRVTAVNYLAVLWATKLFLPLLLESRGHVVNVASLAGRYALPGSGAYAATKHAVVALSESLYHELKPRGVMVTVVNPGLVETEGFPGGRDLKDHPVYGRFVLTPQQVAETVLDVVRRRRGPEVSIPRWLGPLQAFRVLTPPLYRGALERLVHRRNPEKEP